MLGSVRKTGRLVVADTGGRSVGFSAEVVARVAEEALDSLKCPPRRVALPDAPTPTTPSLAGHYYPRAVHIAALARSMLGTDGDGLDGLLEDSTTSAPLDIPDMSFVGPF